jgi:hypothetical protein
VAKIDICSRRFVDVGPKPSHRARSPNAEATKPALILSFDRWLSTIIGYDHAADFPGLIVEDYDEKVSCLRSVKGED